MFEYLIENAEKNKLPSEISGNWRAIQLKINSFAPQFLNVGIVFFSEKSGFEIKVLDNYEGLKSLMPNEFNDKEFSLLLKIAESSIKQSSHINQILLPTPTLKLSNTSFFSGSNPESITKWLFEQSVTLSKCVKTRKKNEFKNKSDDEIRRNVINLIFKKDSLQANEYLRSDPYPVMDQNGKYHYFEPSLITPNKAGVIANAWHKRWETIKSNVLSAQMDISTIQNLSKKQGALFIQRPDTIQGMSNTDVQLIDQYMDELLWKLNQSPIRPFQAFGMEQLADQMIEFAKSHVA